MATGTIERELSGSGDAGEIEVTQWAALAGRWNSTGNEAEYEGRATAPTASADLPYGVLRSGVDFRDGVIKLDIQMTTVNNEAADASGGVVLGFHSLSQPYTVVQIGAWGRAYAIGRFTPGFGWEEIAGAGARQNLQADTKYAIDIAVRGQRVRMSVNDVDVLEAVLRTPLFGSGMGLFAWGGAPVHFRNVRAIVDRLRVFVVMPFSEPFDTLYHDVIDPVAHEMDIEVTRVDEISGPGIILDDIRQQIEESHAVVAEVSTPNPNVFYELGYAHALKKPAVLLARREPGKNLPFDIQGYRAIFYDDSIGGKKAVEAHLRKHLEAIKRDA